MNALGLVVSDKKIFENAFWKPIFDPVTNLCNQLKHFDHPGIIPVKFGENPMRGFRGEDVKVKKGLRTTHDARRRTTDKGRSQ